MTAQEHVLRTTRYRRGRSPIRGGGTYYGTLGSCSCGEWSLRWNLAPTAGGSKAVKDAHKAHLLAVAR